MAAHVGSAMRSMFGSKSADQFWAEEEDANLIGGGTFNATQNGAHRAAERAASIEDPAAEGETGAAVVLAPDASATPIAANAPSSAQTPPDTGATLSPDLPQGSTGADLGQGLDPAGAGAIGVAVGDLSAAADDGAYAGPMICFCVGCGATRLATGEDPVGAPGPPGTLQTLADYLRVDFWDDFDGLSPQYFNVTGSGTGANSGTLYYNVTGTPSGGIGTYFGTYTDTNGVSAARATLIDEAFKFYEAVTGINFVLTTATDTGVDFFFIDNDSGKAWEAPQYFGSALGGPIDVAVINVASNWQSGSSTQNGYTYQTFLHEIGHALGLGHQGLYNAGSGSPTYGNSAIWENDSWALSMMSYWDQVDNTSASTSGFSYATLVSPMTVDWIALNALYSGQGYGTSNAFTGSTIYGVGTNITTGVSTAFANLATYAATNAFTIVDGGGTDTVDFSNYANNQVINLNAATAGATNANFSSVGGLNSNMSIAAGTTIENATTGSGNDTLIGNAANNYLRGNGGNDSIDGGDGNDTVDGGTGADTLVGGLGNDLYIVDNAGDVAGEVAGGVDTVQSSVDHTLHTNLENLTLTGSAVNGTGNDSRDNVIIGNSQNNVLSGLAGNDSIVGGSGLDTLFGGTGNDTLLGGFSTDSLSGGDGDDTIVVLDGEFFDNVDGGAGADTLDHSAVTRSGDTFDFEAGQIVSTFDSGTPTLASIEVYLDGSGGNTIVSDGDGHSYYGNGGDDTMIAEIGAETMDGGAGGTDTIDLSRWGGDYIVDMTTGSSNYGGELYTNFENLISGAGNDSITGTAGTTVISTNGGNDTIVDLHSSPGDVFDGGDGIDTLIADITWNPGVTYDLAQGWMRFSGPGGTTYDTILNVENLTTGGAANVTGTADANVITITDTGSFHDNTIVAAGGGDTVSSGIGNDSVDGGAGNDALDGGVGNDTVRGGGDNDIITDTQAMGASDDDVYDGGGGTDTLVHDLNWVGTVKFDLTSGFTTLDGNNRDQLIGIENLTVGGSAQVRGSSVANVLTVNGTGANIIDGESGADTINAGGGNDTINAGSGNDSVLAGDGDDVITDTQSMFSTGQEDDVYDGGAGTDTLIHDLNWVSSVTFDLNAGFTTFSGNRDQLISIENLTVGGAAQVRGSSAANVLIVNGTGANIIDGEDGNDTINAGGGNDSIDGGSGADSINAADGDDLVYDYDAVPGDVFDGGAGIDTLVSNLTYNPGVTYDLTQGWMRYVGPGGTTYDTILNFENLTIGGAADVTGTTGNNVIVMTDTGGAHDNTIYTLAGNDVVSAGLGNDTVDGGDGDDTVEGGAGDDSLNGGGGAGDLLSYANAAGAVSVDLLSGSSSGADGNDTFAGFENVLGSIHDDLLSGDSGNNVMQGGNGNDSIVGDSGLDTLVGGSGNDTLLGGFSTDSLSGDDGDDTIVVLDGEFFDNVDGGAGADTLDHSAVTRSGDTFDFEAGQIVSTFDSGTPTLASIEVYLDGSGGNTIVSDGDGHSYYGNGGDDIMIAEIGAETMDGGVGGTDTIDLSRWGGDYIVDMTTGSSNYGGELYTNFENLISGAGADSIVGTAGANSIDSGDGNDTITAGDGNDTLYGGAGDDSMRGGTGDDVYYVDSAADIAKEKAAEGQDTVYSIAAAYTIMDGLENLTLNGPGNQAGTGNKFANVIIGQSGDNLLVGAGGTDSLVGGDGNDTINGGNGIDTMVGGLGDDVYKVDSGSDSVVELLGEGTDSVDSTSVSYTLAAEVESLNNLLTTGVQTGTGNALDNVMVGAGANDKLFGVDGDDSLSGFNGNDALDGGNGNDTLNGGNGDDALTAGSGNDSLLGGSNNDTLFGGNDNDTLDGGNDNDSLAGGAGADSLLGGSGNDTLNGGADSDFLSGGFGSDDYIGIGTGDVLTESGAGIDRIFSTISFTLGNNFEYLELTSGANGTGNGLDNTLIGNTGANVLAGLAGADSLYGREGNDTLDAGADAIEDQFFFDTALNATTNVDTLLNAEFAEDQILLDNDIFTALLSDLATNEGTLGAAYYFEGAGSTGSDLNAAIGIYYDLDSGSLYYNPTGSLAGDNVLFASIFGASAATSSFDFTLYSDG